MLTETRVIGEEIDRLFDIRERIRALEAQVKDERSIYDALETQLMERMETEGMSKATGKRASVGVSESVVANVEDWDELYRYIGRNKAFHLLQRRTSDAAYRELMEQRKNKPLPGVSSFTKRKLNLRTV